MKRRGAPILALLLALIGALIGGLALAVSAARLGLPAERGRALIIRNALVLDPRTEATALRTIHIEDGRITRLEAPSPGPGLDAGGRFVVPGLIDAHTHMLRAGSCGRDEGIAWSNIAQIPLNFDVALQYGATTVVDLGGPLQGVLTLRDRLRAEASLSPRYLVAGPILTAPGGYPLDWTDPKLAHDMDVVRELHDPARARQTIEQLADAGVDVIKLAAMELSYNERPLNTLSSTVARAAVSAAHARGLRVFVHAHTNAGYRTALDAGADVIAHSTFEPLTEPLIERIVKSETIVIPTLWVFAAFERAREDPKELLPELRPQLHPARYAALVDYHERLLSSKETLPEDFLPDLKHARVVEAMRNARSNLKRLADAGAIIGYGSDTAFCYALHGAAARELAEMERAGLSRAQILAAATLGSARAIGQRDLGIIEVGARADLLILKQSPLETVSAFARPLYVIRDGRPLERGPIEPPGLLRTLKLAFVLLAAL